MRTNREDAVQMSSSRSEEAQRRAQDLFAKAQQRDVEFVERRTRPQQAESEKYFRLRGLRLGKEAADKEAKDRAVATKLPAVRRWR
jgi:hypothetical protein